MDDQIPRRNHFDLMIDAERGILGAVHAVEALGADPRLTDAVIRLGRVQALVAHFVDSPDNVPDMRAVRMREAGEALASECHGASSAAGWWEGLDVGDPHVIATKLMLMVSEICEAMEGHRKNLMDDHLPHRPSLEVELADAMIRIADLAGRLKLDLGGAIAEKMAYNAVRADHKPENRAADGGKKY